MARLRNQKWEAAMSVVRSVMAPVVASHRKYMFGNLQRQALTPHR